MHLPIVLLALALVTLVSPSPVRHHNLNYDADLARYKLMPMSAAAYSEDPAECIQKVFAGTNATLYQQRTVSCSAFEENELCSGFTALSHVDQAIIVSFRGTTNSDAFLSEINQSLMVHEPFIAGGKVSRYFLNAFKYVWNGGMKDDFLALRNKYPSYDIWITGHGLGGAMASVCAANIIYLKHASSDQVRMITFGQPRTGNIAYADVHDNLVKSSFRVVHNLDPIVHIPLDKVSFEEYQHHKSEVFYGNNMETDNSYVVCPQQEGTKCSDSALFTLLSNDNKHYFGTRKTISDYGIAGCSDS